MQQSPSIPWSRLGGVALALSGALLLACSGDDGMAETSDTSGGILTLPDTNASTGGEETDASTTAGTSVGTTEGVGGTDGVPCETEADCETDEICKDGFCQLDPLFCGADENEEEVYIPPNVVLVLDKSGSMVNPDNNWDDDADDLDDDGVKDAEPGVPATPKVTRWRSLHEVVQIIGESFDSQMNLGAQLFPSVDAQAVLGPQACVVAGEPEVLVDFENAAAVLAGIPPAGAMDLAGGTPAEKGMNSAIDHLAGLGDMNANYIILITDGAANCSTSAADDAELLAYDVNLVPTIAAAASAGITTFVVGVDIANEVDAQGINPYEVLNDAALAGGSPKDDPSEKFYNAVNKIELEAALQQIFTSEVLSCKITLNVPDMKMFSKVEINGVEYPDPIADDVDCATTDGWRYTDESETEIELCGAACTDYQTLGTVQLIYSCFEG